MARLPAQPETDFQRAVIELAQNLGWRCAAFRPARTAQGWRTAVQADGAGWPDLVLVKDRVLYRELKAARGRLSDQQKRWRTWLLDAGQDWAVWRPKMWDEIEKELRR